MHTKGHTTGLGTTTLGTLGREVRHALRGLVRTPGYTLATVLTLALGLGGAAAVLALAESILRPLPFPAPDRLVAVHETHQGDARAVAPGNYLDWRGTSTSFQDLAAWDGRAASLTVNGSAERGEVAEVSGNFFRTLGVDPEQGRGFDPRLDTSFPRRVAVLSHAFWRGGFGGDPDVVGRTLQVDDLTYEVVGVMPAGFTYPDPDVRAWLRSPREAPDIRGFTGDLTQMRDAWYFQVIGRLAPDIRLSAARTEMNALARRFGALYPDTNRDEGIVLTPLLDDTVAGFRSTLLALGLAVTLLLLTACVNVAHLALARRAARSQDLAVRAALGASRAALLRHVLAEAWLVSLGGALVGVALASGVVRATASTLIGSLPRGAEVALRAPVVAAVFGLALLVGTALGLVSLRLPRGSTGRLLRARGARVGASDGLVAAQVAAAVALVAGATLLGRSLSRLADVDPGFATENLVTLHLALPDARTRPYEERLQLFRALATEVAALPGVSSVGLGSTSPLTMGPQAGILVAGAGDESDPPSSGWQPVDPGYFRALGIPLLRGRRFETRDEGGADVGIVNEALARLRFPGQDALGRQVTIGLDGHDRPITIVGVVADTRTRGPARAPGPVLYRPMGQTHSPGFQADAVFLAVRTATGAAGMTGTVQQEIRRSAPGLPVYGVARGDELLRPFLQSSATILAVLGIFGVTALLLGAVGVYGVAAYAVRQRRRDIGVRLALGADGPTIIRDIVGRGLRRAAPGVPVGLLLTFLLGRALGSLLFEVPPTDAVTWGGVSLLVMTVTALALWLPARHAARTDAAEVLRSE